MPPFAAVLAQGEDIAEKAQDGAAEVAETAKDAAEAAGESAQIVVAQVPAVTAALVRVGAVLLLAFVVNLVVRRVIRRLEVRVGGEGVDISREIAKKRAQTLGSVLRTTASVVIWAVAGLIVLGQADVDIGPLLAAAGVGGLAIGFGAQSMVRDVISGFFVLLEDQYHVGDVVAIAGVSGVVEKITLRTTFLRDIEGRAHAVPNGEIRVSTNYTKDFSRYLIALPVPYDEDIDRVVDIVRDVVERMRSDEEHGRDLLGPLVVLGVDDYAASEIVVKVYIDTLPGRQWAAGRELRRRIKLAYDEAGVSIPFPHREVIVRGAIDQVTPKQEPAS